MVEYDKVTAKNVLVPYILNNVYEVSSAALFGSLSVASGPLIKQKKYLVKLLVNERRFFFSESVLTHLEQVHR